ncbi:regulatory protein YycI of two-component signal transduction system YycFG [Bacillus mesophilus]|uniref:Transcriptional regulator n=1 Tax=Bacillus mesophilus TaxID=1808955 RepID=A0A6M0QC61_9BACI|nr:two-component system regulatory protein YycI [Bacillus mesophilus]MBM7662240.1 regulatory protein YycI of two-component signal transduction system YycFG [Bacillus mesophilus]NEY73120.1 transcriptional regulator [Bacillus mesophilus]
MNWSRIKTIFIIVFLVLDLFLLSQFVDKRNSNQLGLLAEATLEDQLRENDITYPELPKDPIQETYITGSSRTFTAEDLVNLEGQQAQILNKTLIYSKFEEPVPVPENSANWLETFVSKHMISGEDYVFWGFEEKSRMLIFFQQYEDHTIFYNENAVIKIILNEKNEMIEYQQTVLTDLEEMEVDADQAGSFTALKAIENMFIRNEIKHGSTITQVDLGYYTLISDSQVFVPTWHFIIDNKENYFVNAIEGHIIRDSAKWSEE